MTFVLKYKGMENIAGYLAAGLIGISLGLIGGGGSIITIPVLVYLCHIEPTLATAYSLFIVGTTSLVGGVRSALNKMVDIKSAILFAIPSIIAIYLTRHYLLPHIPDTILRVDSFTLTKNIAIMIFFSIIMMAASIRMIIDKQKDNGEDHLITPNLFMIFLQGLIVGVLSGIVGAGGGFLIIPALVLLAGLPMKKAIGTSLIIIAVNSLAGFLGDFHIMSQIDFSFMLILSVMAIAGIFLGTYLSRFVKGNNLKSGFGWFAFLMAIYIVVKEVII